MASIDKFNDHCWNDVVPAVRSRALQVLAARDLRRAAAGAAGDRSLRSRLSRRPAAAGRDQRPLSQHLRDLRASRDRADQAAVRGRAPRRHSDLLLHPGDAPEQPPARRGVDQERASDANAGRVRNLSRVSGRAERHRDQEAARQRVPGNAAGVASDDPRRVEPDHLRREHVRLRARERGRRAFERLPCHASSRNAPTIAPS